MPASAFLEHQERERLQSQYAEIAALAGGLAHEIKNPLSTISMNLELLAEELEQGDSPRDRRMLGRIARVRGECGRLEHILDAFLQFARAGELKLVETDLNELLREFIDFYLPRAAERRIEISPHLAADLPPVLIDRSLIRQALENLALNAEQAMPDGGLLELQTSSADDQVRLELIDNGVGMDPQTQARMFQVFFSTRRGGSGLGLPTARKIVEAHRGSIVCDSEPGRGTRFSIALPSCDPAAI
ncbi:MAG: ATP-binding protein [Planctomycetales bacterium]